MDTHTRVGVGGSLLGMPPAGESSGGFSEKQIQAIRDAFRWWWEAHGRPDQTAVGERIGASQQTVSRLLGKGQTGLKYDTATRIAILVGHPGVDALLMTAGLAEWDEDSADPYPTRRVAITLARILGASEAAIRAVCDWQGSQYSDRSARWWLETILRESDEDERRSRELARHVNPAKNKPAPKRTA